MSNTPRSPAPSRRTDGPRVLVAEDDAEMRGLLVEALTARGLTVHAVADGTTLLLELARKDGFHHSEVDIVVTDVRMPLCSGLVALQTVRTVGIDVPFVLLTAFPETDLRESAERLDATVLDKPVTMDRLAKAIRARLSTRPDRHR